MGFLYKSGRVRSFILIFLTLLALVVCIPVGNHFISLINNGISKVLEDIQKETGLKISYQSMSPSLMKNVSIRQIEISSDEGNLLSIQNVKAGIKISELFKKNIQNGITYVLIDGVNIEVSRLLQFIQKIQNNRTKDNNDILVQIEKYIPGNVKLKNININYEQNSVSAHLNVKKINVNTNNRNDSINFNFDSDINVKTSDISISALNQNISCRLNIEGNCSHMFDEAHSTIKISNLTNGFYKVGKLNFQADYKNHKIELHTIQTVNPIFAGLKYDVLNNVINAQIKTDSLKPFSIISANLNNKTLKKLKNLKFTTDTILNCSFSDKKVNFLSDSSVLIPDEIFPEKLIVDFSVFGNQNELEISKLLVEGKNCSANAKLNYSYSDMQLTGVFDLPYLRMKNGKTISTEVYFEALDKGFMAFSPQLFIEEQALTALQLYVSPGKNSIDFRFETSDYSHSEDSEPGTIQINGSYLLKSNYIQSNVSINTVYLDTVISFIKQFSEDLKLNDFTKTVSSYAVSTDLYFSSDFRTVSYNVPYIILANTQKDNQVLMLSLNGNEQGFQMNNFSVVYGKVAFDASGSFDWNEDFSNMFFSLDLITSFIPYHFSGSVMSGGITVSGDYSTQIQINVDTNNKIDGFVKFSNLPVFISNKNFIFSTEAYFTYDSLNGPEIKLSLFELELPSASYSASSKITLSGNITKYGAQINSISYSDLYSALQGEADVTLNINNSIFDSIGIRLDVKNPFSHEAINFDGILSNPEQVKITKDNFLKTLYLTMQLELKSFGLNRFALLKNDNNQITASLYASGVLKEPYISLNVSDSSVFISTSFLKFQGSAVLEDKKISINNFGMNYRNFEISDIQAECSLEDMNLDATGNLSLSVFDKSVRTPLSLQISNVIIPKNSLFPESFVMSVTAKEFSGSLLRKTFPVSLNLNYSDNQFIITSSDNVDIKGSLELKNGLLDLSLNNNDFISFGLGGIAKLRNTNLSAYNIRIDLPRLFNYLNLDDLFFIENGILTGDVMLNGSFSNPEFSGAVEISSPVMKLPSVTEKKIFGTDVVINFNNNELLFDKITLKTKNNEKVDIDLSLFLNKWLLDRMEGSIKTQKNHLFPIKLVSSLFVFEGDVSADLQLLLEDSVLTVEGKLFGENVNLKSSLSSISNIQQFQEKEQVNKEKEIKLQTNLDITLGTHASISFDPLLRCVFVPNTHFSLNMNQELEQYSVNGELNIRSGDVSYLNRNFYIKTGSLKFNPSEILNPIVTLRAETREKDYQGQTVKIIMSVENQYLSRMEPKISSDPAKSENDLQALLGQIVVADSNRASDFLFAASDYALQSTVIRSVENKLRDLLNFDIFSIRTNILQNTLSMGISGELSKNNFSIGNFLDNSTVYIGRYLGSSLYVDAMLHISFENSATNDIISVGKPIFQPEFGLELESPFSNVPVKFNSDSEFLLSGPNIRINMAPDIGAMLQGQFVPSTSLTLSWKLTF